MPRAGAPARASPASAYARRLRVLFLADAARAQDKTRTTLTMDDLSAALAEYGINARKPDFYT
jgi:hypothetical protein